MPRHYDIDAPIARALDLLGERWTLLIIRQLLSGEQRFGQLYQALYGVSSNLLSMRLRMLVDEGILERQRGGGRGSRYRLSPSGEALGAVVWSLDAWARTHLLEEEITLPRHDRCGQPLTQQWYCPSCRRNVEESELLAAPSLLF